VKILLVEDEYLIAMTETNALKDYGYEVRHVSSGEKAIEIVKSEGFDLILMDINLENEIDGIETAQIILDKLDIPIIFVSSHIEKEVVERTEKVTSYGYVVKSSTITVLDASIKKAMKLFNAKKEVGKYALTCRKIKEELNGIGMPDNFNFDNSEGFGLQLISGLLSSMQGSIRIDREVKGASIIIEFKYKETKNGTSKI